MLVFLLFLLRRTNHSVCLYNLWLFISSKRNRRDQANNRLPHSSSIDSMVEAVWSEPSQSSLTLSSKPEATITSQYLQISYGNAGSVSRRESLLSPSANRRTKLQRGIASKCCAKCNFHLCQFSSSSSGEQCEKKRIIFKRFSTSTTKQVNAYIYTFILSLFGLRFM